MSWHNSTRDASYKGGQGLPDRCDVIQLASGRTTAQMGWTIAMSQYLWLTPGRTYIYSIQGALYGSRSGCIVERYNPTGGYISTYGAIPLEQARSVENVNAMNWDRKWVKFTIPENHEGYVRVFIGLTSAGDRSYSDGYFFRPMLEEVPIHQNEPSPWSDSATLITPNSISTNNLAALSSNMGRLRAGEIVLGNAHRLNSDGSVASWWNGGGTGTHLASDGVIRTNAIEIRGGWVYDPINVNGKFIVKPEGLVEIWGDDRANGIVLDAKNRYIAVMENGVPKVKLGRLW